MTLFYILAAGLLALALAFLFVPLVRPRRSVEPHLDGPGAATGLSIYRSQLAELDADHHNGVISESQYNAARLDLQRGLLEMSGNEAVHGKAARSLRWPAGIGVVALLPILAVLIYQGFGGGPAALDPVQRDARQAPTADTATDMEMIVATLRERLDQSPDDPVGWALLGRVYKAMGRTRASAQAYAQSIEHGGNHDADILIDYADVLGSLTGGDLEGRPRDLIRRALEIEPDHETGLWLAGTADFRAGNYQGAREHWLRLARLLPAQSENGAIIRANLTEVDARLAARE
ncbi:c-type cytochrome biogenesis protein CcmI [Thioalkalivibrio sp.]|uniref:c-type cytochrome biogenesis protein CcmI n=1 Tax=Thioalkalivibrio sp. TaxID=2093813 RepID=UPI00397475F8